MTIDPDRDSGIDLYRRLLAHVLPHKWIFLIALAGMVVVAVGDTTFAWLLQPIMDKGFVERDQFYITWIPVLMLLIAVFRALGEFVDGYCMSWVGRSVIKDLRQKMYVRLLYAPTRYYDDHPSGNLVSRLTYDVEQVAKASSGAFRIIFRDGLKAIFLLMLMFYLSWKLSLIFLFVFPLAFFIFKIASEKFRKISSKIQESVGDITHVAKEAFIGHRIVKVFGGYKHEERVFDVANSRNRQQSMKKAAILSASVPLTVLLMGAGVAGVIWLALVMETKPGVFTSYLVSMTMMMRPIKNLSKVNEMIQSGIAGAESIFRTIDLSTEEDNGTRELMNVKGDILFEEVSFRYKDENRPVVDNISFRVPAGSTVALVGPSGSGKSTIASLLLRFYSPDSGSIRIDGIDLKHITLASLRAQASIVSQDIVIFDDSIRNNIAYGEWSEIDEGKLIKAAQAAHVSEFVETMKDGFDTLVGEGGTRLSGGQRQRVAIARTLYKDAPILILDEATSSLDARSERHIQVAVDQLVKNRTTLVIAHRLSTIEKADKILVIDRGRIIEQGTHKELMNSKTAYYQLYQTQHQSTDGPSS